MIPLSHPRYESLRIRELIRKGIFRGLVVQDGLVAHGRGEAFDYLLGETTLPSALRAITAAAAHLILAKKPTISVNGNSAALVPREIAELADAIPADVEVNLFHKSKSREERIGSHLIRHGVKHVLGVGSERKVVLPGISSNRSRVDPLGIASSDVVLIPLEDGDRASALRSLGKIIIAIDLNPFSRTSRVASVSIVDNILRAIPGITSTIRSLRRAKLSRLREIVSEFDNQANLVQVTREITKYLNKWTRL